MGKKCKCPPEGAPEWMVTYGDMVTLLLCFFVLIVSFSEIKKEDQFQAVVEEIKKAFGLKGGGGKLPTKEDPELTLIERIEAVRLSHVKVPTKSNSMDPGTDGIENTVTTVRKGDLFTDGTRIVFEPGSASLSSLGREMLDQLSNQFRGSNHIIEVHGHAARLELEGTNSLHRDLYELSFARARAVMLYLTDPSGINLDQKRFRVVANAAREPLVQRDYATTAREPNRRVEVYATESLVAEFEQPDPTATR